MIQQLRKEKKEEVKISESRRGCVRSGTFGSGGHCLEGLIHKGLNNEQDTHEENRGGKLKDSHEPFPPLS